MTRRTRAVTEGAGRGVGAGPLLRYEHPPVPPPVGTSPRDYDPSPCSSPALVDPFVRPLSCGVTGVRTRRWDKVFRSQGGPRQSKGVCVQSSVSRRTTPVVLNGPSPPDTMGGMKCGRGRIDQTDDDEVFTFQGEANVCHHDDPELFLLYILPRLCTGRDDPRVSMMAPTLLRHPSAPSLGIVSVEG